MRKHFLYNVASIRTRAPIEIGDDELLINIGAALGGNLEHLGRGRYLASPLPCGMLNPEGELFNACYGLRHFADLRACTACVMDLLIEQLELVRRELGAADMKELWRGMLMTLSISGMTLSIAQRLRMVDIGPDGTRLTLAHEHAALLTLEQRQRIEAAIKAQHPDCTRVMIDILPAGIS